MHRVTISYGEPSNPEQFEDYYRKQHLPLVEGLPGLRRFTTTHPRGLGDAAPYLVAELWFDDAAAMDTALRSPQMAAATDDARSFDVASMTVWTGEVSEPLQTS